MTKVSWTMSSSWLSWPSMRYTTAATLRACRLYRAVKAASSPARTRSMSAASSTVRARAAALALGMSLVECLAARSIRLNYFGLFYSAPTRFFLSLFRVGGGTPSS